ncbi:hypothetical protein ACRALDRAFT_2027540 [Sodiomyces alcalophilus JCM 7366]|uniref:uncharacterized protein n=1 Tax=Sodiomyces alcalophilus JCM 7366 TaxID=591952 RepID=UPI0039B616DC
MERHKQAVSEISAAVKGFFDRKEPYRIFHGSTNSTRPFRRDRYVDISALNNVIEVDKARRVALVEPNVPMDRLVESTLRHGLIPPIVMEFPGITTGGGYAGTAGESSSFRHGFFDDTINEVEMVLANGDVVTARPEGPRADLFRAAAGAVGTLGITTLIEIRLIEAKRFVRTTYHRTNSVKEAIDRVHAETLRPENDYVDGILFSKDHGVIITGSLTDEKPPDNAKPQTFSGAWDPWYYLHVRDRTKSLPSSSTSPDAPSPVDYIPLAEYLFRYDRGGFWVAASGFDYFRLVPFTRFFRWLLDDLLHTRMLYRALHGSGESAHFFVQDLALPYANAEKFIDFAADKTGIWPLWLCPLQQTLPPTFHPHTGEPAEETAAGSSGTGDSANPNPENAASSTRGPRGKPMLNIGLWGWGPKDPDVFVATNRAVEAKLTELGGMKWLYAHVYQSEDDFWRAYGGRAWYDALRAKYGAESLPTVYDKVHIDGDARTNELKQARQAFKSRWPVGGLWGIWKAIRSRDYRLHRDAQWKYKEGKELLPEEK